MAAHERVVPADSLPDTASAANQLQAYRAASQIISGWLAGAAALALLRGALDAGLLDAARAPTSLPELAAATGLQEPLLSDVCTALDAQEVMVREGERYRLAPDIAFLLSPEAFKTLPILLDWARAQRRMLEHIAVPTMAIPTPLEDTLARAQMMSPPLSPAGRAVVAATAEALPEARAIWEVGGRHCELGCGVGGQLLGRLALFPRLTAVGVDVDGRVLEQARQNAARIGVADRVELRHIDAREMRDEAAFDTLQWSQSFFPVDSRAATLAVIHRALRPGGYLLLPLPTPVPVSPEELHSPSGQDYARNRLIFGLWGVNVRSDEQVRAEVEGAGFTVIRIVTVANRQMLARRSQV